jgi:signal peptidase I
MLYRRLPRPWATILDWATTVGVAILFVLAFEAEVAKPYQVPSSSMEPTLHCARPGKWCRGRFSDRVLVNRLTYRFRDPRRGDVVVFNTPPAADRVCDRGGTYLKRIVGLPGEQISEVRGYVFVDGRPLAEPYVARSQRDTQTHTWPRVPPSRYFMVGDNRAHSCDSRLWGSVPRSNLIGTVAMRYWPPGRISLP